MEPVGYAPILPFTEDPSPSFVHGFEAGQIWSGFQSGCLRDPALPIHSVNTELVRRMSVMHGYVATFRVYEESPEWTFVEFEKRPHLTVVTA